MVMNDTYVLKACLLTGIIIQNKLNDVIGRNALLFILIL